MQVKRKNANPWLFTAVYASPKESVRQNLWSELGSFRQTCGIPWLLAGDFNETRNMEERCNCSEEISRRCINSIIGLRTTP